MLRKKIHQELIIRHKEYFETKLAISLLDSLHLLPAVAKISKIILNLLVIERSILLPLLGEEKLQAELYDAKYFGRLTEESIPLEKLSAERVYDDMYSALSNQYTSLDQLMQIHSVFIYRMMKILPIEQKQNHSAKTLLSDRARVEVNEVFASDKLGINRNKVLNNFIKQKTYQHHRAVDRFAANSHSRFFQSSLKKQMPFVAGPSGHTYSLLTGALSLGLKGEELKEYALACFVFLAAGGNHSFFEVMSIAKRMGICVKADHYAHCLPTSFKKTDLFIKLKEEFSMFLEEESLEYNVSDEEMAHSSFGRALLAARLN